MLVVVLEGVFVVPLLLVFCGVHGPPLDLVNVPTIKGANFEMGRIRIKEFLDCLGGFVRGILTEMDISQAEVSINVVGMSVKQTLVDSLGFGKHALGLVGTGKIETDRGDEGVRVEGSTLVAELDAGVECTLEKVASLAVSLGMVMEGGHVVEQLRRQAFPKSSNHEGLVFNVLGAVLVRNLVNLHLFDLLQALKSPIGVFGFVQPSQV